MYELLTDLEKRMVSIYFIEFVNVIPRPWLEASGLIYQIFF